MAKNSNFVPELIAFTPTNEICQQLYCQISGKSNLKNT
jgi:hypothetical protein